MLRLPERHWHSERISQPQPEIVKKPVFECKPLPAAFLRAQLEVPRAPEIPFGAVSALECE